jgi:hypothetical protein
MGTSTCDIMVADEEVIGNNCIKGICGQVDGSVIPGFIGLEAGQSAFGDVLAWFKGVLSWPIDNLVMKSSILSEEQKEKLQEEIETNFIRTLAEQAEEISLEEAIPIALDWINGRRTPDANQELKAAISGISLGTNAPHIWKALVNGICFGSKMIVDRFESEGVKINTIIGINAADTNNDPNEAVILSESEIESIIKITNRRRSINIPNIPIHVDLNKQKHIDFVYDYIRSLIRYIRTTTAIHYVPSNIKPPNTSHRSVQYIGKLISKLAALTDKQIGVQNRMKIRLYRKLLNPLVIAVRHREDLIQLRTAHSDVTTKYGKLVSSMNRKATVGIDLGLPEIKRDILMYIERYGMPEEFIFETDSLNDIRRELNSSAPLSG